MQLELFTVAFSYKEPESPFELPMPELDFKDTKIGFQLEWEWAISAALDVRS